MPKRTWNKKYTKKKSSSQLIDERIALLDREMRKTKLGEAIANSTSGLYTITGFEPGDPAIPEIPAVPAVPPTYENVTGGLSNPDDFVWGDQGDGSNPDAPVNIPSNLYTTYNGQQVAALRTPEVNHGEGVTPLAFVYHGRAISSQVLGFLGGGGFTSVVQSGVFTTPGPYTGLQQAYLDAWNNFGKSGIYQYYTTKTIYLWGPLDCLFGSCYGGAQYSPANLSNTSTPKANRALYPYTLVIPTDASGNPLPNRIMTDPGAPEIPAVPGTPEGPPKPVVLSRYGLGDPNFFPGFIRLIGDILGLGGTAIEAVKSYTSQLISPLVDALGVTSQLLSSIPSVAPPFLAYLAQQQGIVNYTEQNPFIVNFSPQVSQDVSNTLNSVMQSIPRERWENLNDSDLEKINTALNKKDTGQYSYSFYNLGKTDAFKGSVKTDPTTGSEYISGIQDNYVFTSDLDAAGIPGAKELINLSLTANNAQNNPDLQSSSYTYTPGVPGIDTTELKQKNLPIFTEIPPPQLIKENARHQKKSLNETIDVQSVKIKLREIDFFRHYKVSQKERDELEDIINKINLILDENPGHIGYLKKRYPKDDVRLAELNWKMDQMLQASKEYVDTHFPENQKLFKKLQQSIKRNIKLTDPKTFKNVSDTPSFKKLLSVDYVNKVDTPKKKPKLQNRNKKTAARFLKKPRIKSAMELIDEKIIQLEKDLKKTGIGP